MVGFSGPPNNSKMQHSDCVDLSEWKKEISPKAPFPHTRDRHVCIPSWVPNTVRLNQPGNDS